MSGMATEAVGPQVSMSVDQWKTVLPKDQPALSNDAICPCLTQPLSSHHFFQPRGLLSAVVTQSPSIPFAGSSFLLSLARLSSALPGSCYSPHSCKCTVCSVCAADSQKASVCPTCMPTCFHPSWESTSISKGNNLECSHSSPSL